MSKFADFILTLDRRYIFLLLAIVAFLPLYHPFNFPGLTISDPVKSVYDTIEELPEGSVIFMAYDFDPASMPELFPMGLALTRHAFKKNHRVVGSTLALTGIGLAEKIMADAAKDYGKKNGEDYVFLGWKPSYVNVMIGLSQDLYKTFPEDNYGQPTRGLPVLAGVSSMADINYLVCFSAGVPGPEEWYVFARDKHKDKFEMAGGCTAVMAPGLYTFLNSGQINGLLGGMRGAAEYEKLIGREDAAIGGMDVQSTAHFLIIFLVLLCNFLYLFAKPSQEKK